MSLEDLHLNLRNLMSDDYDQLKALMDAVYHDIGGAWPKRTIDKLIQEFPDGQIAIEDDGLLVGVALTVQVDYDEFSNPHKYDDLIGHREVILNDAGGDALYGLDVLIRAKWLMLPRGAGGPPREVEMHRLPGDVIRLRFRQTTPRFSYVIYSL